MGIIKKTALMSTLILTSLSTFASNTGVSDLKDMSDNEKKQFVQMLGPEIVNYLVQNPEFLIEASKNLQAKEKLDRTNLLIEKANNNLDLLVNDEKTPFIGDKNANLVIVSFTDYNCVFCKKSNPILNELISENGDLKFVFKEFPIFQDKSEGSKFGALVAQKVYKEKGASAYKNYHDILMSNEDMNNVEEVIEAANKVGLNITKKFEGIGNDEVEEINSNIDLAGNKLNITGTPAFIIVNIKDKTKTKVISGLETKENMQKIILEAK